MTTEFTLLGSLDMQVSKMRSRSRVLVTYIKWRKHKTLTKFFIYFGFCKIIVLRDIDQLHSDLDHTTHMHMHTVRMDSYKSRLFLKIGFFAGCANPNRSVPGQQTSTVVCWSVSVVCDRTEFLSSHKPQPSHVGLDHLDWVHDFL
jgi:hypothetical protein